MAPTAVFDSYDDVGGAQAGGLRPVPVARAGTWAALDDPWEAHA
jgi:hypothetical protein